MENLRNTLRAHHAAAVTVMPGGKKTIVDVRVKDLEKWRYPSKHYVSIMAGDGLGSDVLSGEVWWGRCGASARDGGDNCRLLPRRCMCWRSRGQRAPRQSSIVVTVGSLSSK